MGDQTVTRETEIGQQSPQAQQLMQLLTQLAQQSQGQLGDLSSLAAGNIQPSEADQNLVDQATQASAEMARQQALQDYETTSREVEDTLVGRGMDQSTIGAVQSALQGRQYQQQLGQIGLQQQAQSAEMLTQLPMQRAETQISANQAILQRILGGSRNIMNYDLQARLGNRDVTETRPFDWSSVTNPLGRFAAAKWGGGD
jgi:hypothetical protein